ncbi:MAG: alanine racemase [bacterium]|nr:alanine racemase [bacterium]
MMEYYRVQAKIDLDAICHNLRETKKRLVDGVKLMAIIKADGYGHGAVPIAWAADSIVDAFGVAIIEEALELRSANVTKPILILGYTSPLQYEDLINNEITQTVYSYDMAQELSLCAGRLGKEAMVHIKLDTGMSRIGFKDNDDSVRIIKAIEELPNIKITGMFTHFACADMTDKTSANKQFERYLTFAAKLEDVGINIPVKHAANSAAIIDLPSTYLNMVRSGISTYGLYPSEEVNKEDLVIKPALELITRVVYVKEVEIGTGIGYGSTFVADRMTKVATVPVGYADGYPRALSNKGYVLIQGKKVPIIGRVCMDQFMVDVTDLSEVKVGDKVTLIGTDGYETITVEELADLAYTFNYEFVCDISKRVPRVYYKNGKKIGEIRYRGECKLNSLQI